MILKIKYFYIIILIMGCVLTKAQPINFTDLNLKNFLLTCSPTFNCAGTGWDSTTNLPTSYITIDINNNGEIDQSEALAVTYLSVDTTNSSNDLSDLRHFMNLKRLSASGGSISNLNLSALTQIEILLLGYSQLSNLNLTGMVSLKNLYCWNNQISTINLTGLVNLELLMCTLNPINTINFSGLLDLKHVDCVNTLVSSLDFTGNPLLN